MPFGISHAQEKMSLKDAISIALNNNYNIKLSNTAQEINKNNASYGNAGFFPALTGTLSNSNRIETSSVDLASGQTKEATNAKTTNLNYGVSLNWKIFDGMQMFATYENLYFTGDGALRDEVGYYRITGRVDDVLNVSGHRIGTAEVENAINMHAGVIESAVVGYPHDVKGQGIYAYVI